MLLDDRFCLLKLLFAHTHVPGQIDRWIQPELRLSVGADNVDVHSWLFSGKEEKAVSTLSMNRR
jgi:hypothetical protein